MRWGTFILLGIFLVSFVVADIPTDCDPSMVSYWRMENNLADSKGGNTGTWTGGSDYNTFVGFAADFDGSNKITFSGASDLGSYFTVEMMIDINSLSTSDLFSKGEYSIELINGGLGSSKNIKATIGTTILESNDVSSSTPYHIALVKDGSNVVLYLDGVEQDSGSVSSPSSSGDIVIGDGFDGLIDEVAVYNSAFEHTKIISHYSKVNIGLDYCDLMGSGSNTKFTIAGCDYPGGSIAAGDCSSDATYFCEEESIGEFVLWDTMNDIGACSFGDMIDAPGPGEMQCCPSGLVCRDDGSGPVCQQRENECSTRDSREDCEDERCYWLEETESCVDDPTEYSCDVYTTEDSCSADSYRLGVNGLEAAEKCGSYFNAGGSDWGYDNCACEWDAEKDRCGLTYDIKCFIDDGNCGSFKCTKNFDIGECVGGTQLITWTASPSDNGGRFDEDDLEDANNAAVYEAVLEEACSESDGLERACGSEVVKLPGFSIFSFIAAVGILGLFYYFKRD